jgi:protein tyrosine/serine phosphatase
MKLPHRLVYVAACLAIVHAALAAETNHPVRPASWAKPLTAAGVKNFYQVTTNLYRGAQPTAEGMKQLQAMGIKTVINLRAFHSDKDEVAGTGLKSVRFETEPWHAGEADVIRFLKVVVDTNNLPAFVHCQRGADRTGLMCAMYRICVGGWSKADAVEEMKNGGFGFNPAWSNLTRFIEKADVEKFKREAGLSGK